MTLNKDELKNEIYGLDGLYSRVIKKIEEITERKAANIIDISTQQIYNFKWGFSDDHPRGKATADTVLKYAEKLGVE